MQAKLYKKEMNTVEDSFTKLCYKWSDKEFDILARMKFLPIKGTPLKICIHYLTCKQHRVVFHKSSPYRRSHALDLIYTNVCSINTRTLDDALCFVIFINDYYKKKKYGLLL